MGLRPGPEDMVTRWLAGWLIRAVAGFNTSLLTIIALNELLQLTVGIAYPFQTLRALAVREVGEYK